MGFPAFAGLQPILRFFSRRGACYAVSTRQTQRDRIQRLRVLFPSPENSGRIQVGLACKLISCSMSGAATARAHRTTKFPQNREISAI